MQVRVPDVQELGADLTRNNDLQTWHAFEMSLGDLLADHYGPVRLGRMPNVPRDIFASTTTVKDRKAQQDAAWAHGARRQRTLN